MNKTFNKLAVIALIASTSISANAGEMKSKKNRFEGFYIGLSASHLEGTSRQDNSLVSTTGNYDIDGQFYGVLAGYNKEVAKNVIAGLEADFSTGGADGDSLNNCSTLICYSDVNYMANIKARLGYTVDRFMPFISAGLTISEVETGTRNPLTGNSSLYEQDSLVGVNYGAGVEAAIDDNFSFRLEYSRVDLGQTNYFIPSQSAIGSVPFDNNDVYKIALTYKFDCE